MDGELAFNFVEAFEAFAEYVHEWANAKGFWEDGTERNEGEIIALIHSELSEALEALRHGNPPDDKVPEMSGVEAELADAVIRIMDYGHGFGYKVAHAVAAKMAMNEGRPYKHGKEF